MAQKNLWKVHPKIEGDAKYGFGKISFIKSDTAFTSANIEGQVRYDTSEKRLKLWNGSAEIAVISDVIVTADITAASITEAKIAASSGFGLGVLRVARAKYSFAVDGGTVSLITPAINAAIPDNAVIVGGTINSTTAATSGGSATISVGTSAGSGAASLLAATAVASFSVDALLNSAATHAAPVKLTAAGSITLTVAVADLTAGIIEVTVLYFVAAA